MAIARLNSNLKTITFSTTISIQENLELKDGTIRSIYKSKHEHLGTVDIDSDYSLISSLTQDEVIKFTEWAKQQQNDVKNSYLANHARGFLGGYPVIKRSVSDDEKYRDEFGFIKNRRIGEFIGVIADPIKINHLPSTSDKGNSLNFHLIRKDGTLVDMLSPLCDEIIRSHKKTKLNIEEAKSIFQGLKPITYLITEVIGFKQSDLEKKLPPSYRAKTISLLKNKTNGKFG